MEKKVAILMPFHKEEMNDYELISFKNNTEILFEHPIYLILPEGINPKRFLEIAPKVKVIFFESHFFNTYHGSNIFWLKPDIYYSFRSFKFLLKCELDVFIFKDDIDYWCNQHYDYIGAPWLDPEVSNFMRGQFSKINHSKFLLLSWIKNKLSQKNLCKDFFVGNGGLSLRKTSTFLKISKLLPYIMPTAFSTNQQEDLIWSLYVSTYFPFFKIPDYRTAMKFSLETGLDAINSSDLPFGCHAWYKENNFKFWKDLVLNK